MRSLLLALLLFLVPGCAGTGDPAPGQIQHVVVMWLKEPGDAEGRAKVIEASRALASIPGVLAVRVGEPLPSEREVVDDSFDVAIVLTLADAAALAAYEAHPDHVGAVEDVLAPLVARFPRLRRRGLIVRDRSTASVHDRVL